MMDHAHRAIATPTRNVPTTTHTLGPGIEVGAKHDIDMRPKIEPYQPY